MAAAQNNFVAAIGGIMHESNSFNPAKTVLADFQIDEGAKTPDLTALWRKSNSELSGYLEGAEAEKLRVSPGFFARATPKGPLTKQTFDALTARLIEGFRAMPRIDGILLALHGAMVADGVAQADEEIVRRVRTAFPKIPIVVTHDFHANVSAATLEHCTALLTYQQNPHLDTKQRGERAARILARTIRGEIRPVQAIVKPAMVYNIIFQNTYAGPFHGVTRASQELEKAPGILAASVPGGYQYADVPAMGPKHFHERHQ